MSEWQPIESAPKDGSLFVATGNNYGNDELGRHYAIASYKDDAFKDSSECGDDLELIYLTHWMPIPAIQKENK